MLTAKNAPPLWREHEFEAKSLRGEPLQMALGAKRALAKPKMLTVENAPALWPEHDFSEKMMPKL